MSGRTRGTVVVLGAVGLTLALLDLRGGVVTDTIREAGATALSPLQNVAGAIATPAVVWVQDVGEFSDAQARSQLWSEQAPDIVKMRGEARVAELDALLGAVNATGLTVTPARVVSFPMTSLDSSHVVVDVGSDDGIELDAAVLTGAGVVGRTISTAAGTTDIKLISARDSAIGCRFLRTGQACIAQGTGDPASMTVRLIDPIADVKVGDTVLTFGSKDGAPFVADLPIGTVSAIDSDGAAGRIIRLKPAVNLTALDLVGVVSRPAARGDRSQLLSPADQAAADAAAAAAAAEAAAQAQAAADAAAAQQQQQQQLGNDPFSFQQVAPTAPPTGQVQ
ncbi:MAG: rod shape-determining protein MreC [Actinobacteria bacterium]|nr:MAG: rod shape-determining protein MreC [Actinomycetota bacterium]